MSEKPSGRILVDASGKERHVTFDDTPGADNSEAHGYDAKPGTLFNEILHLPPEERELVLAQPQAERARIMKLDGDKRSAAIAALADPKSKKSKSVPPAGDTEKGSAA